MPPSPPQSDLPLMVGVLPAHPSGRPSADAVPPATLFQLRGAERRRPWRPEEQEAVIRRPRFVHRSPEATTSLFDRPPGRVIDLR